MSIQVSSRKVDSMSAKRSSPEDRKQLLRAFYTLPSKDKQTFYRAVGHLRWLTILWGLEELSPESTPSISEKRHLLLAYKILQIIWFSKLPEQDHRTFTVYVRDRLPDDQDPQVVNDVFETDPDELAVRSTDLARPGWLKKEAKAIKISLQSFPINDS
jgi:hypothetical protein